MAAKPSFTLPQIAEQLDSGHHWPGGVVTYSFPQTNPDPNGEWGGFSAFTADQQAMAELVLGLWADVANITFELADDPEKGQIRFYNLDELPAGGQGAYPGDGDVRINPKHAANADTSLGGGALFGLLHEIGHALGLSHPGDYDFNPDKPDDFPTYEADAEYLQDSNQYTVMSYFAASYTGAMHDNVQGTVLAQTPLLHDIYAIQQIYGTNLATRAGDTVYGFNSTADRDVFDFDLNPFPVIAIWDGGGVDTLDLSGYRAPSRVDLADGAFSDVNGFTNNIAIANNAYIENVIGGDGNDSITGNEFNNVLHGGDGNDELSGEQPDFWLGAAWDEDNTPLWVLDDGDELHGGEGRDTLRGGWGDDLLRGDAGIDDLNGGAGDDELNGGAGGDTLVGDAGADEIHGGSSDDEIWGHRHEDVPEDKLNDPNWAYDDVDHLYGGDGGDTIHGGYGDDWIWGDGGQDDDGELNHSAVWTGVDRLYGEQGSDTIQGGNGGDFIYGGDDVDYLYGENGADTLSGENGNDYLRGGAHADNLLGGSGEDELYGDDGNDRLHGGSARDTFSGGAGIDMVTYWDEEDRWDVDLISGLALNLDANYDEILSSIENLELGAGNDTADGTDGANEIWGLAGNDTIRGRNGNDTLYGDTGIDHLFGDAGNDVLDPGADDDVVNGGAGIDRVTYASSVEGIYLDLVVGEATGADIGTDAITLVENATGGRGDDMLLGDSAANRLEGGGGADLLAGFAGNDTLLGGAGNDALIPGLGNDTVDGGAGIDRLDYSDLALSWTIDLSAGTAVSAALPFIGAYHQTLSRIEDVTMGDGNDTVYGDAGSNRIVGLGGNDLLHGGGGNDELLGGNGNDTLYGGPGEDWMHGGDGDDVFLFRDESQLATVDDFTDGSDLIGVSMTLYQSFDDLAIEADADGNAVIYMGPRQITLVGVSITAIDNSDFIWL